MASDKAGIVPNVPPWLRGGADAPVSVWRGLRWLCFINDGGKSPWKIHHVYGNINIWNINMENMDGNINIWKIYHKYIFCQNLDYIYIYIWIMMSVGMMTFPTEWKNNSHVPNHQPENVPNRS